jgi:hypothetical protein
MRITPTDLRLLLKHCPEMAGVQVNHPDNCTEALRADSWLLVRYAHTQERFGGMGALEIAKEMAAGGIA